MWIAPDMQREKTQALTRVMVKTQSITKGIPLAEGVKQCPIQFLALRSYGRATTNYICVVSGRKTLTLKEAALVLQEKSWL